MYEAYFGLRKRPFTATPDASCLFAPPAVQSVLDELIVRTVSGEGIGVLTAPSGMGKTLLCRRLVQELAERHTPLFLANANFPTRRALLQAMHYELGRRYSGMEEQELRLELISSLKGFIQAGRPLVLVVDEAHLLNPRLLEELRALASQSEGDQPLLRLILAGQLTLEEKLIDPALTALNQRIVSHVYLEPFMREESGQYIAHRIAWAGGDAERLFEVEAVETIARIAGGVPRCLNQLCDHCLLLACVHEMARVTVEIVAQAHRDLKQLPLLWNELAAEAVPDCSEIDESDESDESDDEFLADESAAASRGWCDTPRPATGAMAFEIGEDASAPDENPPSLDAVADVAPPRNSADSAAAWSFGDQAAGRVVPLSEGTRSSVRVFQEEHVDDRYAALDMAAPRIVRTFDDLVACDRVPAPEMPPVAPLQPAWHAENILPGDAAPDIAESLPTANPSFGAAGPPIPDDRVPATTDETYVEAIEVEEEIGDSVLDTCLEIQQSLGHWWEATAESVADGSTGHDNVPGELSAEFRELEAPPEYDVVEPEIRLDTTPARFENRSADQPAAAQRHVPAPNYRNVFSALRQKLGKSLRH